MNKKLLSLLFASTLVLSACGEDTTENATEETATANETEQVEEVEVEDVETEEPIEDEEPEVEAQEEVIEDSIEEEQATVYPTESYPELPVTYETDGAVYIINNITKSTGGMTGAEIITIDMEFTNRNEQPTSPYMQFISEFDVQQTDGTTTESLMGANSEMGDVENQEAVSMGDTQVNSGASVNAVIGFTLVDENADVGFITRSSQITGEPIGFAWSNE